MTACHLSSKSGGKPLKTLSYGSERTDCSLACASLSRVSLDDRVPTAVGYLLGAGGLLDTGSLG